MSISVRRSVSSGLVVLCALAAGLALGGVSARAEVVHKHLSQITEVPASSGALFTGQLSSVRRMTIDSGHLWVEESLEGSGVDYRVNEFDKATGAFLSQIGFRDTVAEKLGFEEPVLGLAVAHGRVYIGATKEEDGAVVVFSEAGSKLATWTGAHTPAGSFGHLGVADVASDESSDALTKGDLYVDDEAQKLIDVFKPEAGGKEPPENEPSAADVTQLAGTCPVEGTTCTSVEVVPFNNPERVVVNQSTGEVLVLDQNKVDVFKPEALGGYEFVRQISGTPAGLFGVNGKVNNLAVDGSTGEIYVAENFGGGASSAIVDQFSSAGVYLGQITGLSQAPSVTVDPVSGDLYVAQIAEIVGGALGAVDVFGPSIVVPDVATGSATNVTPRSATLTGTVKLDKEGEATCGFVWGTTTEFGHFSSCVAPASEEESHVEARLSKATDSELQQDTTYYYRLQATNKNETNGGEPEQDQHFHTPGPGIHSESVSNVAATSATLETGIDPDNAPTTYYFQYGTNSAYEATVPAAPGLSLGSGVGDVRASQHVQGLLANKVYHYRVVAVSQLETSPGHSETFVEEDPDRTFTTQGSGAFTLPDGRQWEMATSPEKNGALFLPLGNATSQQFSSQAAASGDAIVDEATQPVENESQGSGFFDDVLSTRGPSGWSSQTLTAPHNRSAGVFAGVGGEYVDFSEDLSLGILQELGQVTPLSPEASEATPYLRSDYLNGESGQPCRSSCFTPLVTEANTAPGIAFGTGEVNGECPSEKARCGPAFVEATPDAHHILLGSRVPLTEGPSAAGKGGYRYTYIWSAGEPASKQLQPVAQLPASEGGGVVALQERTSAATQSPELFHFSLANNGSYFFSSGGHLYVHDTAGDESFRLDIAQGVSEPGSGDAELLYASQDGSMVLFDDSQQLTNAAGGGVYECRLAEAGGRQACSNLVLTGLPAGAGGPFAKEALLGSSADGSYLYFLADGPKLYVDHDDGTEWKQTLVAALDPETSDTERGDSRDWTYSLEARTLRVSPNGEWLAFMSQQSLTGYDNDDIATGLPAQEVYEYNAKTARLVCASCDPSGSRPNGTPYNQNEMLVGAEEVWPGGTELAADIPPWTRYGRDGGEPANERGAEASYQSRYLSDDGRLFFNSHEGLVPDDVNGQWDVYEYEPEGAGSCGSTMSSGSVVFRPARSFEAEGAKGEEASGCVGLISSGISPEESAFLDASEGGGNVFFLTQAKLTPQDLDTAFDVYDAHECTSESPCLALPAEPVPVCVTEASCKPSPTPQPSIYGLPSSATFSGPGNAPQSSPAVTKKVTKKTVKCKRGFVKDKRGKCVRAKPRHKRVKAKKSIHRKGSR